MRKIINLFLSSFFLLTVSCFQSGINGPEKPIISDEITDKWKSEFENKYNCKIDYLGLNDQYEEDSIIYLNLIYDTNSIINEKLTENWRETSKEIGKSFYQKTNNDNIHYLRIYYEGRDFTKFTLYNNLNKDIYELNKNKL